MKSADTSILNFGDAREYLGISRSTLLRWIKDGRVKGYKAGRNWKFYQQDLAGMLVRETETPYETNSVTLLLEELQHLDLADAKETAMRLNDAFWCEWQDHEGWLWLACNEGSTAASIELQPAAPGRPVRQWPLSAEAAHQLALCWRTWQPDTDRSASRPGRLVTLRGTRGETRHVLSLSRHIGTLSAFGVLWPDRKSYRQCQKALNDMPGDWLVSGPPEPGTVYAAYALAAEIAELMPDRINRIITRVQDCTVYWPDAIQTYSGSKSMLNGCDLCLFQLDDGESYPARQLRSPRVRIGYTLNEDRVPAGIPARAHHVRVGIRDGRTALRTE